jgi:hypothetical protein
LVVVFGVYGPGAAQVLIGLLSGGIGPKNILVAVDLVRDADGAIVVTAKEGEILSTATFQPHDYVDGWSLAEHAMRMLVFGVDELPPAKPLDVPIYDACTRPYVKLEDIPEPARSAFEARQRMSGKPANGIWGANHAHDWLDGNRDWY